MGEGKSKTMKIAIDLEGTLIAECGEFACERTNELARCFLLCGLRVQARKMLKELARAGHILTLYTSGKHSAAALRLWCLAAGLPIHHIITLADYKQDARHNKGTRVCWPPVSGQDLILDDETRHIETARRKGVTALQITNHSPNWTACIQKACLSSDGIRMVNREQKLQPQV